MERFQEGKKEMLKTKAFIARSPVKSKDESDITSLAKEKLDFYDDTLREKAEVYKNKGNEEYARKEFNNAIHFYTEGIQVNCKDDELNAKLYNNRSTAHFYLGDYQETLNDARVAVELQPTYIKAIERGARACMELRLYQEAITWCDKGLAINKVNKSFLDLRSKSVDELRESPETKQDVMPPAEERLDFDDDGTLREKTEAYKTEGNNVYQTKKYAKAIHFYTEGIKVNCKDNELNAKLYSNRAAAHFYLGNYHESLNDARAAVELQQTYIKAIARGASACVELRLHQEAITWCDKGLAINKEDKELLDLRSRSVDELSKLQHNMKNESDVTPPAEEKPDLDDGTLREKAEVYKNEGNDEYARKDFNNAIHFYTKGIQVNCRDDGLNAKLYSNRATAHFYLGNYQESLNDARAAVELQPTYIKAIARGANACAELGLYEEAISWCDKGLAINKRNKTLLDVRNRTVDERNKLRKANSGEEKNEPESQLVKCQNNVRNWATKESRWENIPSIFSELLNGSKDVLEDCELFTKFAEATGDKDARKMMYCALGCGYQSAGDFQKAIHYNELFLKIAKELGDRAGEGAAYSGLGNDYSQLGNFKKALDYHERCLKISKEIGNRPAEGDSYGNLGNVYHNLGDFPKAIQYHELHLNLIRELGDRAKEGIAHCNLGKDYHGLKDFKTAISYHEVDVKIAKEVGDLVREGRSLGNLGNVYFNLGDFKKAIEYHELSVKTAREVGNRAGEGDSYGMLGSAYHRLRNFKKGILYHELQLEIAKEVGDREGERCAYCNLGTGYVELGDYEKAIRYDELHLKLSKEVGNREGEGKAYGNLGSAYGQLRYFKKATRYHELSLEIAKETRNRDGEVCAYGNLATCYGHLGYIKKSIHYHELHLNTAKDMRDRVQEGNAYDFLGIHYHRLGDFQKAIHYHELYLEISKELNDRGEEGRAYANIGINYCEMRDFKKAIHFFELQLRIAKEINDHDGEGRAYDNLGTCYLELRDFKRAIHYHELHLKIAKEMNDRVGEGRAYCKLGNNYLKLGDSKTAIHYHELSLRIAGEVGDKADIGSVYCGLGTDYHSLGDFRKALHYFGLQLEVAKNQGDREGEGGACSNLGNDYRSLGNLKKAVHCHQRHLEIAKESRNRYEEGCAHCNLGNDYGLLNDYQKAIHHHEFHLEISKEMGDRYGEGSAYGNLGNDYHAIGDFQKALRYHDLNLEIAKEIGDLDGEGRACGNLGRDYQELGDLKRAIHYHERRLEIAKRLGDRAGEGYAYFYLGSDYAKLGNPLMSIHFNELSLEIVKEVGDKAGEGNVYGHLGCCYETLGNFKKGNYYHKLHLSIAKEVGSLMGEGVAYNNLGYNYESQGFLHDAVTCYQSSVRVLNDVRTSLQFKDEWKISLHHLYQNVYSNLWSILLKQDKVLEALIAAELGRAQALKDLMELSYGPGTSHDGSHTFMKESVSEALSCLPQNTVFTAVYEREVVFWVIHKDKDVKLRRTEIRDTQSGDMATFLNTLIPIVFEEIGARARAKCEDRSLDKLRDEDILGQERSDQTQSHPLHFQSSALITLYNVTVAPIADLVDGDELVIVPEGTLWLAPYAALIDSNLKYLSETFRIRLIPSLSSFKFIADCPADYHCKTGALLVGDPWVQEVVTSGGRKLQQLPCAKEEVEMIGRILNTTPLTGTEATKNEVLDRLSSVALVHIAAHGRMESGEIALSPNSSRAAQVPRDEDYLLTMTDVLGVKLRARLVVLSCCHSGRGEIKAEGVVGIARAFLGAGARSVLVSLWAIDDEATLEFMKIFYQHLVEGKSASEALNRAMKSLRESDKFSDLKYWAPFVLIGDDVTLEFNGGNRMF